MPADKAFAEQLASVLDAPSEEHVDIFDGFPIAELVCESLFMWDQLLDKSVNHWRAILTRSMEFIEANTPAWEEQGATFMDTPVPPIVKTLCENKNFKLLAEHTSGMEHMLHLIQHHRCMSANPPDSAHMELTPLPPYMPRTHKATASAHLVITNIAPQLHIRSPTPPQSHSDSPSLHTSLSSGRPPSGESAFRGSFIAGYAQSLKKGTYPSR